MEELLSLAVYVIIIVSVIRTLVKKSKNVSNRGKIGKAAGGNGAKAVSKRPVTSPQKTSSVFGASKPEKKYDTFNTKKFGRESGAMEHKHETKKFTSMCDASNLPPGYILLNGEPVRVADLENR